MPNNYSQLKHESGVSSRAMLLLVRKEKRLRLFVNHNWLHDSAPIFSVCPSSLFLSVFYELGKTKY